MHSRINNTGVTGQSLPPKNDFEHALGLRNSVYAVNLTYETYRHTRHTDIHIREYGSTLYVGLARAVSPTNTNFRLTFSLTRLQEDLYEDLAV